MYDLKGSPEGTSGAMILLIVMYGTEVNVKSTIVHQNHNLSSYTAIINKNVKFAYS